MTNPNYTHISFLIDESGSMLPIKEEVIKGYNSFVEEQKKSGGYATITVAKFASTFSYLQVMNDLTKGASLSNRNYFPNGSTAMYASQYKLIEDTGIYLGALHEDARPGKVLFVTISDGEENYSSNISWYRFISKHELSDKIREQQDKYAWEFVYLGETDAGIKESQELGYANSIKWNKDDVGRTFSKLSINTLSYRENDTYDKGTFSVEPKSDEEVSS